MKLLISLHGKKDGNWREVDERANALICHVFQKFSAIGKTLSIMTQEKSSNMEKKITNNK